MKTSQRSKQTTYALFLTLFLSIFISCSKESNVMENEIAIEKEIELTTFKGLPVSHRFTTPIEELETSNDENNLRVVYAKIKAKVAKKKRGGLIKQAKKHFLIQKQ